MKYFTEVLRYFTLSWFTLRETVHRKESKTNSAYPSSGSILVDLDRLRLCTFPLPFTLDPKIVHSFPFRAPRYFPASILFDILLQIERFLALPPPSFPRKGLGMHSKLDLVRVPRTVLFLHACICFIRFDGPQQLLFQIIQFVVSTEWKYFEEISIHGKIEEININLFVIVK